MMMTITKKYKETDLGSIILYTDFNSQTTNVFYEYRDVILNCSSFSPAEIIETIKNYRKVSKSNLRVVEEDNGLSFYKPNKYVFPVFRITFKNKL